jgi:hypothetical protein
MWHRLTTKLYPVRTKTKIMKTLSKNTYISEININKNATISMILPSYSSYKEIAQLK